MCGIYIIRNKLSGKLYVGQSRDPARRWLTHQGAMRRGVKTKLYDAMRAYGVDAFEMEIVQECPIEELNRAESEWIARLGTLNEGYNMIADCTHGRQVSEETRRRMSEAQRGKKLSPEHRAKIAAAQLGRKASPETTEKVRAALTGLKRTPESIAKIRAWQNNRSDQWRASMSASQTGKKLSVETRQKLSAMRKGVPKSEATKAAMSEAAKLRDLMNPGLRERRAAAIRAAFAAKRAAMMEAT